MELSDQVITLQHANKLKELGFNRDSYCCWITNSTGAEKDHIKLVKNTRSYKDNGTLKDGYYCKYYPAYTASELMEFLPDVIRDDDIGCLKVGRNYTDHFSRKVHRKERQEYWCSYWKRSVSKSGEMFQNTTLVKHSKTLAQSLGDMLIYLLEKGYIKNT